MYTTPDARVALLEMSLQVNLLAIGPAEITSPPLLRLLSVSSLFDEHGELDRELPEHESSTRTGIGEPPAIETSEFWNDRNANFTIILAWYASWAWREDR